GACNRDRDHRRPCLPGGARQPDRRASLRIGSRLPFFAGRRQMHGRTGRLQARTGCATIAVMQQSGIVEPACPSSKRMVTLPARPESLRLAADQTAVVVIDMQNAYASPGGYVDLAGFDIAGAAGTITNIAAVLETARAAGVQIVYLQNGWDPDYVEAGGAGLPN